MNSCLAIRYTVSGMFRERNSRQIEQINRYIYHLKQECNFCVSCSDYRITISVSRYGKINVESITQNG
ncbi:MAG: hypothetical protein LBP67_01155 [Bacteroidales bacterium]|nr:hypothetical protein [Bacteroidales bacterium]